MISIFKKILYDYRLKLAKKRVLSLAIIGGNSIISATANVKLLYGSSKEDIVIGEYFKISGELISSHHGKIQIGNHCLVGPRCVIGAVDSVILGNYQIML